MPIVLPVEIGDTVYVGRFKNRKTIVKEIGTDRYGQPTINGFSILKIRVANLMPKKAKRAWWKIQNP